MNCPLISANIARFFFKTNFVEMLNEQLVDSGSFYSKSLKRASMEHPFGKYPDASNSSSATVVVAKSNVRLSN
jgi:hypothetical protein